MIANTINIDSREIRTRNPSRKAQYRTPLKPVATRDAALSTGVKMVLEHQGEHESQWAAMESIAAKMGCSAETLRKWVRRAECDRGRRQRGQGTEPKPN